jgi:hypothetical protein
MEKELNLDDNNKLTHEEKRFLYSALTLIACLIGTTLCGIIACIYSFFN